MWNWSNRFIPSRSEIIKVFWNKVAGQEYVGTGRFEYIRPLNYVTDEKEVIINENLPILNLKNKNLPFFEEALIEYVQTFFESERNWANPISSCATNEDKLVHAISAIWLNATFDDYQNPIQFLKRYTNFLKDTTFDEFWEGKNISKMQTLQNCSFTITQKEQDEFQETPTSMLFTVEKNGEIKKLPRIAYGISEKTAYIYGIQGYPSKEDSSEMKKINRSRFEVNKTDNIPEDYKTIFVLKQEPYAYISLFAFLSMLKQKGITKVIMPSMLPQRYEGKELGMDKREIELMGKLEDEIENGENTKELRGKLKYVEQSRNDHQRVQYNMTNKFLYYMVRMECDVPGIEIIQTPELTNGNLIIDISQMQIDPKPNLIFYELYKKIEGIMKNKEVESEGR